MAEPTKKKDGTLNCALCDLPRKSIYHTICSGHMEVYYKLVHNTPLEWSKDSEFAKMNKKIGENLE